MIVVMKNKNDISADDGIVLCLNEHLSLHSILCQVSTDFMKIWFLL